MTIGESFPAVLAAARTGADWAWESIYRDLSPAVTGYLRARGAAEPEDVAGEVFLQVVRDLKTFQGGEQDFRSWVFTIAHHRMLDSARRRRRRPLEPVPDEVIHEHSSHTSTAGAEDAALATVSAQRVRGLIGELSPDQQDVLLLRLVADLTVEEVARIVGKRPGAVKALQRRGLAALKKKLEAAGDVTTSREA
jgi:RNA polymerase sigma factor (sigma-70 family)